MRLAGIASVLLGAYAACLHARPMPEGLRILSANLPQDWS